MSESLITIDYIEQLTKEFADARAVLGERVQALHDELEAAKRRRLRGIKAAVATAAAARDTLATAIVVSPELFKKPRSRILHGIRVGFAKAPGKLIITDVAATLKLIKKHFADQADVLIKTKETPVKKALQQLTAADLKRIGAEIQDTGDEVITKPVDSEIDKLVDALLNVATESEQDEEDAA